MKSLALDTSDFKHLRKTDLLYVDKTPYIQRLLDDRGTYYFLARPRRFGKSLFISTLKAYFEGQKELFEGLYIYDKTDWGKNQYPVIRMNFSKIDSDSKEFEQAIIDYLHRNYGREYQVEQDVIKTDIKNYFDELIYQIRQQTGKKVVLLIDEYDKPITDHITDTQKVEENQGILRKMYEWIKNSPEYWRLVFLTGISKFSKVSVFSALSNLRDISERDSFNAILGFTRLEVESNFEAHLLAFAKHYNKSVSEILDALQFWYNGYSWNNQERIFNPYSILYAMYDRKLQNYWYSTGTPKVLIDFITHRPFYQAVEKHAKEYENFRVESEFFRSKELSEVQIEHLLYNTGYLTINGQKLIGMIYEYHLTYPNHEVRWSFTSYLLNYFYKVPYDAIKLDANSLRIALQGGDMNKALGLIRRFFNSIPYELRKNTDEAYYHSLFQMLMMLIGVRIKSEESGSLGRADVVLQFPNKIYIIEFKYAQSGKMETLLKKAIEQIKTNKYAAVFKGDSRPVLCMGVGFLEKKRKRKVSELEIDYLLE